MSQTKVKHQQKDTAKAVKKLRRRDWTEARRSFNVRKHGYSLIEAPQADAPFSWLFLPHAFQESRKRCSSWQNAATCENSSRVRVHHALKHLRDLELFCPGKRPRRQQHFRRTVGVHVYQDDRAPLRDQHRFFWAVAPKWEWVDSSRFSWHANVSGAKMCVLRRYK